MLSPSLMQRIIAEAGMDDGIPAVVAAYHFECSVATIKGWAARGRLTEVGRHPRLGRLYRWGDLIEADRITRDTWNPNRREAA